MKFSKTSSFFWMPACHDAYSGFGWLAAGQGKPIEPVRVQDPETKIYKFGQGEVRLLARRRGHVPDTLPDGYKVIWSLDEELPNLPHVMINAHDAPSRDSSPMHSVRTRLLKNHEILQDSGGYQLLTGVQTFVDPEKVGAIHHKYSTEGVGLDIPLANITDPGLVSATVKIQVYNNRILKGIMGDKSKLIAVSHGASADARNNYLDVLLNSELDGISIAGLRTILGVYHPSLEEIALHLCIVLGRGKEYTNRYHTLGVSKFTSMVLLAAAARVFEVQLTCDSATHLLCGAGGSTLDPRGLQLNTHEAGLGRTRGVATGIPPCGCVLCHRLRYDFVWRDSTYLQTHALRHLARAHILASHESLNYLSGVNVPHYDGMQRAVDIIASRLSPAKATKRLRELQATKPKQKKLLFSQSGADKFKDRMIAAVDVYSKYHKRKFV